MNALANGVGDIVRFENVGMRYRLGAEVLHDVSFSLPAGSFHFLTGPSGAGKSSLMRLMYLAHRPSRGSISMFGRDVSTVPRTELACASSQDRCRLSGLSPHRSFIGAR
jgi:cell division transport system ATP-binding protein